MSSIKNVAIVGASGRIGGHIANALLATKKHTITAISRAESTSEVPADIIVKKVDYGSHADMVAALKGQEALIITLAIGTPEDLQSRLIRAAADAGVAWVFPNEFAGDRTHPELSTIPLNAAKSQYTDLVEDLGKSSWIGIINSFWYEFSLVAGLLGIDMKGRTASLFDDARYQTTTTTLPQAGRAVASLLSLPVSGESPCLADYKNKFVYVESFFISQSDMLASVQRVTGTTSADWKVSYKSAEDTLKNANERVQQGDVMASVEVVYAKAFLPGRGGDYSVTKGTANKVLGLPVENLDDATKSAFESLS